MTRNLLVNVKFDLHPYQEGTSWSHGEVSHGTMRFLLVSTRNLLVNVKFYLSLTLREPLGLTVRFLMVTMRFLLVSP